MCSALEMVTLPMQGNPQVINCSVGCVLFLAIYIRDLKYRMFLAFLFVKKCKASL